VGMHERVRMLGGSTQIRSRPGGPTVVSASLPAWSGE
jgi:signal transduction histidine kinase